MGADLTIESIEMWPKGVDYPPLMAARAALEALAPDDPERPDAALLVADLEAVVEGAGYYRDSYNDSNLLNKFGYSYWRDMGATLEENGEDDDKLKPEQAKALLELLVSREGKFMDALRGLTAPPAPSKEGEVAAGVLASIVGGSGDIMVMGGLAMEGVEDEEQRYFLEKWRYFKAFLRVAIYLNESIDCSI